MLMQPSIELQKEILREIQSIANAPFAQEYMSAYITQLLTKASIPYKKNEYAIIVSPRMNMPAQKKIVILAHTDHPGVVLKDSSQGIFFGTPYFSRIEEYLKTAPLPINIYDKKSGKQVPGRITEIINKQRGVIKVDTNGVVISKNSIARYDIQSFTEDAQHYDCYNADNGASVATLLAEVILSYHSLKAPVYFVFTMHEEVHQISAWELASKNILGLTKKDFILNLECLTVKNIPNQDSSANYSDGLILQLSNTGCHFGYNFKGQNELENQIIKIAQLESIPLQIGLIQDSCDSRPFSFFPITPHICTLTIPNEYKHNKGKNGEVVPEHIKIEDFHNQLKLLDALITSDSDSVVATALVNTSLMIRENDTITDMALMTKKAILNERLSVAYWPAIKRGYYFPESLADLFMDLTFKTLSYLRYFYFQIRYRVTRRAIAAQSN